MKINKEFFSKDFFKKICGKVSNFTVNKGIGFKANATVDIDESTYIFGIRVKHESIKDIKVEGSVLSDIIKNITVDTKIPKRVIVKGFLNGKGVK